MRIPLHLGHKPFVVIEFVPVIMWGGRSRFAASVSRLDMDVLDKPGCDVRKREIVEISWRFPKTGD
jgi:hypothetical protein